MGGRAHPNSALPAYAKDHLDALGRAAGRRCPPCPGWSIWPTLHRTPEEQTCAPDMWATWH